MVALAFPVFVITTDCLLLLPVVTLPNESDVALACNVAHGVCARAPCRKATCCGLDAPLSVNEMALVRVPAAVGVKVTEIVQLPLAATLVPQLFVSAKSPDAPMLLIDSEPVPVLVKVTDCAELFVATVVLANVRPVDGQAHNRRRSCLCRYRNRQLLCGRIPLCICHLKRKRASFRHSRECPTKRHLHQTTCLYCTNPRKLDHSMCTALSHLPPLV